MSLLREQRPRVLLFVLLALWCAVLLLGRRAYSGAPGYYFLGWNLILAAVPIVASVMWERAHRTGAPGLVRWTWAIVWLAFLPNAPYIVTDFIHLHARPPVPLWYDIALLVSFAGTGLLLGWASVADVHAMVERRHGRAIAWAIVTAALLLCGFGIYVGRFLRWNSWDALLHPIAATRMVLGQLAAMDEQPRTWAVTLVYGAGLLMGYAALRTLARTFGDPREPILREVRGA